MSYEGTDEYLCPKGHYWTEDCWTEHDQCCPYCGEKKVWTHHINETNGVQFDRNGTPMEETVHANLEVIGKEEVIYYRPLYKIPTKG